MTTENKYTKRFMERLAEAGVTYQDLKTNWRYCGGNQGRHLKYFRQVFPSDGLPDWDDECICRHIIKENCYITNGEELLVLGNCCIKRFVPNSGKTCEKCGAAHKNRNDNLCNKCRPQKGKICEKCGDRHQNRKVNRCNDCREGVCDGCGRGINPKYKLCYYCH